LHYTLSTACNLYMPINIYNYYNIYFIFYKFYIFFYLIYLIYFFLIFCTCALTFIASVYVTRQPDTWCGINCCSSARLIDVNWGFSWQRAERPRIHRSTTRTRRERGRREELLFYASVLTTVCSNLFAKEFY